MRVSCEHIFVCTYVPTNVWCWGDYDSIGSCVTPFFPGGGQRFINNSSRTHLSESDSHIVGTF